MLRKIVVIGGSAGALQALRDMFRGLPPSLPASYCIAVHTSPDTPGMMPALLGRCTDMPVAFARDGDRLAAGHVYVAPPDHHLLVEDGHLSVTRGPRENRFRPAVDPLFRTAATAYGAQTIGIVLSGGLDDGTRGLAEIKGAGGIAIVQQIDDAMTAGMPMSAIRHVEVDHIVPANALGDLVHRLVREAGNGQGVTVASEKTGPDRAARGLRALKDGTYDGSPSAFTCPECGGALWEITNGDLARFACHVGHSYTPDTLTTSMAATLEAALWTALRTLEEHAAFLRRMAQRATKEGLGTIADGYAAKADDVEGRAKIVRSALVDGIPRTTPPPATPRPGETS